MDGEETATPEEQVAGLEAEIRRLLAAALDARDHHEAEMERRDQLHVAEVDRRDQLHVDEMQRRDDLHAHELELIREALETRDLIGQAKGIIMSSMGCSSDEAFRLLRQQSQYENRKLVDIAGEVVTRTERRARRGPASDGH